MSEVHKINNLLAFNLTSEGVRMRVGKEMFLNTRSSKRTWVIGRGFKRQGNSRAT